MNRNTNEGGPPAALERDVFPTSAGALSAAREAHFRCDYAKAEQLGRYAASLAAAEGDPGRENAARILAGQSLLARGDTAGAIRAYSRALILVEGRPGLEAQAARNYHDLFLSHSVAGHHVTAEAFYTRAGRLYGSEDQHRFALDADRARMLMETGDFASAVLILHPLVEQASQDPEPSRLAIVRANLTAAVAAARLDGAVEMLEELRQTMEDEPEGGTAWSLYAAGFSAAHVNRNREATQLLSLARRRAVACQDTWTKRKAATLLLRLSGRG